QSSLSKYIDGVLVGTQMVETARYTLQPDGVLLLADDDGETAPSYLAHFGLSPVALSAQEIADLGGVTAAGPFATTAGAAQIGFDAQGAVVERGFAQAQIITTQGALTEIKDMLVALSDQGARIDLKAVFDEDAISYSVQNSNGEAVTASIENAQLALSYDALGLSDLTITAHYANGSTQTETMRLRVAGENAYTIAVLPDTQDYTLNPGLSSTFSHMTQWLVDNAEGKNLSFVTHVGDVTYNSTALEYNVARDAMDVLRDAGISYSLLPGNHDVGTLGSSDARKTESFNNAFSTAYMSQDPTFAGVYDQEPGRYDNNYHLFTAPDGTGWIVLNLEFGPRDDVLRWADDVLTQYGDRKAFVLTHSMSNFDGRHDSLGKPLNAEGAGYDYGLSDDPEGAWDGETIYREVLARHPNVVFTAGGHIFGDGAETTVSYNDFGNKIYQFLVNYQNGVSRETTGAGTSSQGGNGGNGAIRLITVDPDQDAVYTETYFTELDTYFTDVREKEELDRDGLTGSFKGHEELLEYANVGARAAQALADAGDDLIIRAAPGSDSALVTLSGLKSTDPQGDITAYKWYDEDGVLIATGPNPQVALSAGSHDLSLVIDTARGVSHRDDLRVIVQSEATLLVETFNDGEASRWVKPGDLAPEFAVTSTDLTAGLPAIDSAVEQVELTLSFDSHWRPEDDQVAEIWAIIDGGAPVRLLRWDSSNTSDFGAHENERVELSLLVADSASTVELQFAMPQAGNDWYWAIDNLALTGPEGQGLMSQNFDSLSPQLQSAQDEQSIDPALKGWTQQTPEGWNIENGLGMPQGTAEWQGWSFTTMAFWTAADGQRRGDFDRASGVFAVADPDEWDDYNAGSQNQRDFNSTLSTPVISLAPLGGNHTGSQGGTDILLVDALEDRQAVRVKTPDLGPLDNYTLIFDINVQEGSGRYTALLQSDLSNGSDADLFLRDNGDGTAGIGILGDYDGAIAYGEWARVAITITSQGDSKVMHKFVNGVLVGSQDLDSIFVDSARFDLDPANGFLLFADNNGESSPVAISSLALLPQVLSPAALQNLGTVSASGPFETAPMPGAVQLSFANGDLSATDFGAAAVKLTAVNPSTSFALKGSIASRDGSDSSLAAPEGALFNQGGGSDDMVVYQSGDWTDFTLQTTIRSLDDDAMGVLFRLQDGQNYYLLRLDSQANTRQLIKVSGGDETILAQEAGGYRFYDEIDVEITAEGDEIGIALDGVALFGGEISDSTPLGAGTVGYYSAQNVIASFDDMVVTALRPQARAGHDRMVVDFDGDGVVAVTLNGDLSTGVQNAQWLGQGPGLSPVVQAVAGRNDYTLSINDGGETDQVSLHVASGTQIIAADQFEDGDFAGWQIIDSTELDGDGNRASNSAHWVVIDGALVETTGAYSRELTWSGASASDVWKRGWSPHGDGTYALHKGSYALWQGDNALQDYAIEAMISVPQASGGVGFMLNYLDGDNYYKLELDARHNLTTLVQVVDGYETYLGRVRGAFTAGDEFHLRARHVDGQMQAWIDDHQIFAYDHESHELPQGAAGVYAWGAKGARFDDIAIVDLSDSFEFVPALEDLNIA
ncbi:MAG: metallophosphoesterase, partial [Mangrovicoccus sp.]|nr:metallophosphoesterase [Mangrovicoccus sp.]